MFCRFSKIFYGKRSVVGPFCFLHALTTSVYSLFYFPCIYWSALDCCCWRCLTRQKNSESLTHKTLNSFVDLYFLKELDIFIKFTVGLLCLLSLECLIRFFFYCFVQQGQNLPWLRWFFCKSTIWSLSAAE